MIGCLVTLPQMKTMPPPKAPSLGDGVSSKRVQLYYGQVLGQPDQSPSMIDRIRGAADAVNQAFRVRRYRFMPRRRHTVPPREVALSRIPSGPSLHPSRPNRTIGTMPARNGGRPSRAHAGHSARNRIRDLRVLGSVMRC